MHKSLHRLRREVGGFLIQTTAHVAHTNDAKAKRSADETSDFRRQRPFVTMEALNHGIQKLPRRQLVETERVTRPIREECQEAGLSTTVAFAKRMDGIESRQEVRRSRHKIVRGQPL